MTYKTKNTVVVFAVLTMLMAAPLAIGNVYATTGGNGVINPTCGIVEPANISLGTIIAGSTSTEEKVVIQTSGTIPGTFEIIMTDWVGAGAKATGSLILPADADGVTVEINSHIFLGGDGTTGAGQFDTAGATTALQATALAAAINTSTQTVTEDFGTVIGVKAFASENAVLLTAVVVGTGPNAITVTTDDVAKALVVTATLGGGATSATHMTADKVKVTTQTQSEGAPGTAYTDSGKIALSTSNIVLSTETDPDNAEDIDLYFHLDGVSTKATGTITVTTDLADGDTIVIDGITFTAESTAADIDGNEFLSTGTANTDAAALEAKLDATLNQRVTASVVAAVVTITANNGGTEANALTLAETGAGVTLSDSSLNGGIDQLINLPYSGALTSTITFGTACDSS